MAERKGAFTVLIASGSPSEQYFSSQQVLPAGFRPIPHSEEEGREELAAGCPSHGSILYVRRAYICYFTVLLTRSQEMQYLRRVHIQRQEV